jgi:FkbM family methyltransferase
MRMREFRHRVTPRWLSVESRRRARDVLFRRIGIRRCHTPPLLVRKPELLIRSSLPLIVAHELLNNPSLTFLQIGAFDGQTDDDLHDLVVRYKLRGVLVEPQPAAFSRLAETYRNEPQVTLLQAAIAESEGVRELYCRRGVASMAASFHRDHLRRHGIPDDEIVARHVSCLTVESALQAGGFDSIDFVQIDAEGYDWPIIRSIDFAKIRPAILRFEYRNMSSSDADACLEHLARHGYHFLVEPRDIIALRPGSANAPAQSVQQRSA